MIQGFYLFGGDNRDRTDDLLNAIQALSQLSYIPVTLIINSIRKGVKPKSLFKLGLECSRWLFEHEQVCVHGQQAEQ